MKDIRKITTTLLLAILGTFIYSRLIDPNLDETFNFFGIFFSSISDSYRDYLYENVGDGIKEIFSYHIYGLIFGVALIFLITSVVFSVTITIRDFLSFKVPLRRSGAMKALNPIFRNKFFGILISLTGILAVLSLISNIVKHHYTYNTIIYIEKSIDILSPEISPKEKLILISKYRQINNYEKFNLFNEVLIEIANEKNVQLPNLDFVVK